MDEWVAQGLLARRMLLFWIGEVVGALGWGPRESKSVPRVCGHRGHFCPDLSLLKSHIPGAFFPGSEAVFTAFSPGPLASWRRG